MKVKKGCRILFQGDSTTDCGRDRTNFNSLAGYSKMVGDVLQGLYSDWDLTMLNRGVSGDSSAMLLKRLQEDCYDLKPDIVTILIGINDTWRRYDSFSLTTTEQYAHNIEAILKGIREHTNSQIVVLEPFLLASDSQKSCFREDLDPKIQALRDKVLEFGVEYIPLDGIFAAESVRVGAHVLSGDGVHPDYAGNRVIAREILARMSFEK